MANNQNQEFNPYAYEQIDILSGLNPEQKEAVLHDEGPLLILAGAGSGKTRVITHRIAYLVEHRGVSPRNILAITFTNKAAREMKERVENLLGPHTTRGMWIGTFHSMMARVLRQFAQLLGFSSNFTILDTSEQRTIVKDVTKELNLDTKVFDPKTVLNTISAAKNKLIDVAEYRKRNNDEFWQKNVAKIYAKYQERLKANNSMDFDDLLFYPVKLFKQNKDILEMYQDRFQYIMVDEYQDTNGAQYEIVRLLSKKHKNICVVGDDDQSIYSFRGANVSNILNFEKDFKDAKVIKLEQNYRSTGHILAAANTVINNNTERKEKALWTAKGDGDKVKRLFTPTERSEAVFIANEIKRLVDEGYDYNEIAILYRINALSRNLEFAFTQANIPFAIYGGLRFFDRKEIKDTMAYLRLLTSPKDDTAFLRAITNPKRGVGSTTISRMQNRAEENNISLMEVALNVDQYDELSRQSNSIKDFVRLIAKMQNNLLHKDWSLAEFIEYVENASGLVQDILDKKDKNRDKAYTRLENLKELISEAINFQNSPLDLDEWKFTEEELSSLDDESVAETEDIFAAAKEEQDDEEEASLLEQLIEFLQRSSLYSDLDTEDDPDENKVNLMTIHSAKGLEYEVVFVVGMEEGIFPGYRNMQDKSSMEEERRLAYVAMTRAKEKLYLSATDSRLLFGRTERYMPSRFLNELPEENLEDLGYSNTYNRRSTSSESTGFHNITKKSPKENGKFEFDRTRTKKPSIQPKVNKAGNLKAEDINKGDKVKHGRFGVGTVLAVEPVAGDAILSIDFEEVGEKKILANSANLARA